MLSARGISAVRGERQILSHIDLDLPPGKVVGILGANGTGKSTLLSVMAGELPPSAGLVSLHGKLLSRCSARQLACQRALLPQNPSLQFDLPVATIIEMGAYPHTRQDKAGSVEGDQRALQRALALADVTQLQDRRYRELSGGEQQRVHFARVLHQLLLARPDGEYRALMLDEPTASLDPRHQLMLLQSVRTLASEDGIAACVILHDVNLAAANCDQLLLLAEGSTVASGPPLEVLTPEILNQVYDVEAIVLPHPHHTDWPLVVFEPART